MVRSHDGCVINAFSRGTIKVCRCGHIGVALLGSGLVRVGVVGMEAAGTVWLLGC